MCAKVLTIIYCLILTYIFLGRPLETRSAKDFGGKVQFHLEDWRNVKSASILQQSKFGSVQKIQINAIASVAVRTFLQ